eukprot:354455_1
MHPSDIDSNQSTIPSMKNMNDHSAASSSDKRWTNPFGDPNTYTDTHKSDSCADSFSTITPLTPCSPIINTPQYSIHSPIINTACSPIMNTPLYNDNFNTNNNDNYTITNNNDDHVIQIEFKLIHNVTDPSKAEYRWCGHIKTVSNIKISNRIKESLSSQSPIISTTHGETLEFDTEQNNQYLSCFLPAQFSNNNNENTIVEESDSNSNNYSDTSIKISKRKLDYDNENDLHRKKRKLNDSNKCIVKSQNKKKWLQKKNLFKICVINGVKYLNGNSQWCEGDHGPNGLHITPDHWCRYCGSRISKKWYENNRICGKHKYKINSFRTILFKNGNGDDLMPNKPYNADENTELLYLEEFVKELERDEENKLEPIKSTTRELYEVDKLHCKKQLIGEKNGKTLIYYLVKWKKYSIEDCSWEPQNNLNLCDELLRKFEDKISDIDYCKKCKIGGYKCWTKPCLTHHRNKCESLDNKAQIKQLSKIPIYGSDIKNYCNDNGYVFNV